MGVSVTGDRAKLKESLAFRRSVHLNGVEVVDATNTDRHWRWFNTGYGATAPSSWHGEVNYRGRRRAANPGSVFCASPGEIHSISQVDSRGSFAGVIIDPTYFVELCKERECSVGAMEWKDIVPEASPRLLGQLVRFFAALRAEEEPTAMHVQSLFFEAFTGLSDELLVVRRHSVRRARLDAAEQAREILHTPEGANMSLTALAESVGLSRFQTLRAFKDRYGVPPHTYQLCYKIAMARRLLRAGLGVASVAAECGFADQSHFGRHFLKLVGTTPARYARLANGERSLRHDAKQVLAGARERTRCIEHPDGARG